MARDALPRWLPLMLLCLTTAALFHRILLGEVLYWGLPSLQFYPWRDFATSEIRAGRLPFWNPFNGGGAPLLANYQSAVLYPPHLLYVLFPSPWWMGAIGMVHILWAGVGMWRFTGRLKLSTFARGIATLAFPLSSTIIARFGTLPMVEVACWLPWLLFVVDATITTPSLKRVWPFLGLAAVTAMQLLAGHAQWTFYSLLLAGGYGVWRIASEQRSTLRFVVALLALMLGAGIAAPQLLPTAELQRYSQRADGVGEAFALNFSFSPVALATLFNPDFFGNPGDGTYVIGGAQFEVAAYIGILPVILAVCGALGAVSGLRRKNAAQRDDLDTRAHQRLTGFFTLVAVVSLILAFGQFTPVYPFLYRTIPTFSLFQGPARWLLLTVFALAMLAALAAERWRPGRNALRIARLTMFTAAGTTVVSLLGARLNSALPPIAVQISQGIATLCVLLFITAGIFAAQPRPGQSERRKTQWMLAALLFLAVDLWWANSRSNPTTSAAFYNPIIESGQRGRNFIAESQNQRLMFEEFLRFDDYRVVGARLDDYRRSELPNLNLIDRESSVNNFDPLRPEWTERYLRLLNESAAQSSPVWPISARAGYVYAEGTLSGEGRAWIAAAVQPVRTVAEAEQAIRAADPLTKSDIVEAPPEVTLASAAGAVLIEHETPLEVDLSIVLDRASLRGGVLILADTYYPGWQAIVNGETAPVYRANLAFRAVPVPPGESRVRLYYDSALFTIGLAISAVSLALLSALAVGAHITARRDLSRQSA